MADKIWIQLVVPIGSYRDATPVNSGVLVSNAIPKQLVKTAMVARAIQAGRIKEITEEEANVILRGAAAVETPVPEVVAPPAPVKPADTGKKEEVKTPPADLGKKDGEGEGKGEIKEEGKA